MEQKRKIIIPVPSRPGTPQFDAEETLLSAQPVVPLQPGQAGAQAAAPVPFYKRFSFLAVIVIAAVGIGLLGGLGLARMQSGQQSASPIAQPAQATTNPPATVKTEQAQIPVVPEVKIAEPSADKVSEEDEDADKKEDAARAKEADDDKKADDRKDRQDELKSPPPARDKSGNANDDEEENPDADARARRRERRRRQREDEAVDVPRQIERASERINRIREIFEGRQQP